jgi:hypothetical protein
VPIPGADLGRSSWQFADGLTAEAESNNPRQFVCEHPVVRLLAEPASSLSDVALGAVSIASAVALHRRRRADPAFVACLGTMGEAAAWGAVHHAVITPHERRSERSLTAIATTLASGIGLLFAATARTTLPSEAARRVAPIGAIGPVLYLCLAVSGRRDLNTMVAAQGLSMAGVIALWLRALARRQPGAELGILAVALSATAAAAEAIPKERLARVGLDPDAAYHLAQIPGVAVLALAAEAARGQTR